MMKRLIRQAKENEYEEDPYLGKYIQIVNPRSKYFSYYGWVDRVRSGDDKYKLFIIPKEYENYEHEYHINFIKIWDATKWLNIVEYGETKEYEE